LKIRKNAAGKVAKNYVFVTVKMSIEERNK